MTHAQAQNSQARDIQALKDKLQKLEQEIQDVKDELNEFEKSSQNAPVQPLPKPPATPTANAKSEAAEPATAGSEQEQSSVEKAKPEGDIELYGFAMTDTGYDFVTNDPNWFDVVRPTKLPAFKGQFAPNGKVYFSVRQSRFGLKSFTPTPVGDLKTIFEFELFGTGVDAGQTTFRLRHAFGSLGPVGVGQYWTTFMDADVFPNTFEYWGPNGMVNFRNVQLRWVPYAKNGNHIMVALERPGASGDQGVYRDRIQLQGIQPRFNWPDFTWNGRIAREWGYAQLSGIVRKIGWVDTNNDQFKLGGSAVGWGISASSSPKFGPKDTGRFEFVYGEGIENYMNDAPIDIGVETNPGNAVTPVKGVALPVTAFMAFLDHTWSEKFTSSAGYSFLDIDNANAELPSDFHQGGYSVANLAYKPVPKVIMASEFQFGRRVNFKDGFSVNDYRLQFSFKYNWSKAWTY